MGIQIPQHHQFSESLRAKILKETGCLLPEWEIAVQKQDDIAWSIVLAYLISTNHRGKEDFPSRLRALTGNDDNVKLVKKSVGYFNPFRNRFSCFFDRALKRVVKDFKANLRWDSLVKVSDKLSAASRSLNCPILLLGEDPGKYHTYMENVETRKSMITLKSSTFIDECNESNKITVFHFMIKGSLGYKMKRAALLYFLKEVKMSKKNTRAIMISAEQRDNHLLISLLKQGCYDIILKLYKSPYIVSKISEAGYEMDPRSKDNENLSAMYHVLGNTEVMNMLYYFAVNNCSLSEGSYRNPNSSIVSNLLHMGEILSADLSKLEGKGDSWKYTEWKNTFDELLKFNRFLISVNGNIVKIKNTLNYYESLKDDVFEASKRRDIIVTLLDTYKDFFYVTQGENPTSSRLDDYILHRNYYNLIDTATAVIFFDNIVFLKERLTLKSDGNESSGKAEEISRKAEEISVKAEEISGKAGEISENTEEISEKSEETTEKTEETTEKEEETTEKAEEVVKKSKKSVGKKKKIVGKAKKTVGKAKKTVGKAKKRGTGTTGRTLEKKKKITENCTEFSKMESSFCFSVIYLLIFRYVEKVISNHLNPYILYDVKILYIFPLLRRLRNFEITENFSKKLREAISKKNIVKNIPESEIYSTLSMHPELKDAIEQKRLRYYIKTALNQKITNVQSVLVIERTLQVIGEYLTKEKDIQNNQTFLRRFLRLCLPEAISQMLLQLRNELTHLKGHAFPSKFECENNLSLFRGIRWEILEIEKKFRVVYRILNLNLYSYFLKQVAEELGQLKNSIYLYTGTIIRTDSEENLTKEINIAFQYLFKKYEHSYLGFFEIVLHPLKEKTKNEMSRLDSDNFVDVTNQVRNILSPLKWLLEVARRCNVYSVETLLDRFKYLENCKKDTITVSDFQEQINTILEKCYDLLSIHAIKKANQKPLKPLKNIEYFLKVLKGFVFLSKTEQDNIRKEIPRAIRESVLMKEKLIQSIKAGFSYDMCEVSDIEISYVSKNKMKEFKNYYRSKDSYALTILQVPDPVEELEEILSTNSVGKKRYDFLCKIMQFSDETSRKLGKLVAGQRKKNPGNNLENLYNRILLLKKLIIEDDDDVCNLWIKIKSQKSRQFIHDRIVQSYLKNRQKEAAVDMLLFDCMILFETESGIESSWVKSSKLYSGINLRNVMSHGSPLLEFLCELLDPEDLPWEKIRNILRLIEGEDSVKALLTLFELLKNDFVMLLKILNSEEKDEYCELRDRILKCSEWKDYAKLLPYDFKAVDKR